MRTFTHPLLATLPSVLLIGTESSARARFHRVLRGAKFRTFVCAQLRDAADLMHLVSVVVCHQPLPGIRWQDVLKHAETLRNAPSVVVTIPRPLTIDLDEASQAGVFALLEPYDDTELTTLVQRAHAEYQAVRQLDGAHPDPIATLERFRVAVGAPAAVSSPAKWTETASTARFRAAKASRSGAVPDAPEPVPAS